MINLRKLELVSRQTKVQASALQILADVFADFYQELYKAEGYLGYNSQDGVPEFIMTELEASLRKMKSVWNDVRWTPLHIPA